MSVTYTNRKGRMYTLCRKRTKTGKWRYNFVREPKGEVVDQLPAGYEISESVNGIVSLVKARPQLITPDEIAAVERAITRHKKGRNYRVSVKHDRIEIYESVGPDVDQLMGIFGANSPFPMTSELEDRIRAEREQYDQFTPVLRIILADKETRSFRTMRMCYLGSIDDWIDIAPYRSIKKVAAKVIPRLGTDAFFDLY